MPKQKNHFLGKEYGGSPSQGEGLSGSPLRGGRERGRKGRMVHEAPHYRSCARASAEEDESPPGFGLGGKGGASTSQISTSFCFIAAFLLSDSAVPLDSLLRGGWWQCHTCRESRAGISKSCLSAVRSVGC